MPRPKILINKDNAEKIYHYFSKSIFENRFLNDASSKSIEGKNEFLKLDQEDKKSKDYQKTLQYWIDTYVSLEKWTRCLATLRQNRSTRKHKMKSIKLDAETYEMLKNYSDYLHLSIQETIFQAIKPLYIGLEDAKNSVSVDATDAPSIEVTTVKEDKETKVNLWMCIENNNKWVRGKKKAREHIEMIYLSQYDAKKSYKDGYDYILTISYETQEELNEIIDELYSNIHRSADSYNCQAEADITSLDGQISWDN